jgi:predicted neutral ceramidase superfamily lipid hydrolase
MLHRDKYSIEVTDDDIDNAMVQERYNPLQLAIARVTNKCPDEIDICSAGVFISVYDYADFLKYTYEDADNIQQVMSEWDEWVNSDPQDSLYIEPFTCNLTLERSF